MATTPHSDSSAGTANPAQVTEILWQDGVNKLHETNNEILLPIDIDRVIGLSGISTLVGRLHTILNQPVVAFQDKQIGFLRIMPAPAYLAGTASGDVLSAAQTPTSTTTVPLKSNIYKHGGKGKSVAKDAKVPRPPNAFILYRQHHHDILKNANPGLHNNEISVILGQQWKKETAEVKAQYKAIADMLKTKHAQDNPGYQYNPRKPSEKKRRMTARKAAALAESENAVASPSSGLASTIATASVSSGGPARPYTGSVTYHASMMPNANSSSSVATNAIQDDFATPGSSTSAGIILAQGSDFVDETPSSPTLMEFEDGNVGVTVPMDDDTLAKLLMDHNAFLDANPGFVEPLDRNSVTLEYANTTKMNVSSLDSLINWDQITEDYHTNFGELEHISDFCKFFEEDLQRLGSFSTDE